MKKLYKTIALCAAAVAVPSVAGAQDEISIDFESEATLPATGVYDTWAESPFRTGALQGNVAVLNNHLADDDTNPTSKILGVQRSRFGSNTFGVRIDLSSPLTIKDGRQYYAHVMIHKPVEGRVMLIGLGKRADRENQSNQVEQFWTYPSSDVKADEWCDAVFQIKCNAGVEIHSLVVVPHCEAPHTLTADFAAYVDEIVINDRIEPRFASGYYPVNYAKNTDWRRNDRVLQGVSFSGGADGDMSVEIPRNELMGYNQRFETPLKAKAGDNITPRFTYTGGFMHGYVYLDKDNDGEFSFGADDDNRLDTSTDLMAYSYFTHTGSGARNSKGDAVSNNNVLNPPSFTIPSGLKAGLYRMRYKIDWNNIDPAGNAASDNNILNNGGGVVDVLLNIHNDVVSVNQDNRNGEVLLASDGNTISGQQVPFGKSLEIKMNPSNGFTYNGVRVRHGYNLTGDSLINENPQYRDDFFFIDKFDRENNTLVIPGEIIDGDVLIEGLFVEQGTGLVMKNLTYNIEVDGTVVDTRTYALMSGAPYPEIEIASEVSPSYYSLSGYPEGTASREDETITLTITQNLPFIASPGYDHAHWYNMTITANKNYLSHNPAHNYIATSSTRRPEADDHNAQWAFVGNVLTGFTLVNRGAGQAMILSSSHDTSTNTGGNTYPVMTAAPVPDTHNTYWMPTESFSIAGENGFCLHQAGHPENRMNSRDGKLAYWTTGADAGSTFLVTDVEQTAIESIVAESAESAEFFNLQGARVSDTSRRPGIYIERVGGKTAKRLIK